VFEMLEMFGDSTDEIRAGLAPDAMEWLRRAGFDLFVPLSLIRDSLRGGPPRVWLLAPGEIVIR